MGVRRYALPYLLKERNVIEALDNTGLQLRSLVKPSGELELSLRREAIPTPGDDEVVIRVQAAPINPSDLGLLFGPADLTTVRESGTSGESVLTARIPEAAMADLAGRVGEALPVGNEGAGVVISAGRSPEAQALLGKTVATLSGGMYAQYRCTKAAQCLALPESVSAVDGASCFVNPMTALCFLDVIKRDGHKALVHTAAASNLGQILLRVCQKDGVNLINVVRSQAQGDLLRSMGATYVFNTQSPTFAEDITRCLAETDATAVFDAISGGTLGSEILGCIEAAQASKLTSYTRYGSTTYKHLYIYGNLDTGPIVLERKKLGTSFGLSVFLLTNYLQMIGGEATARLQQRVLAELKTTFASHYSREISLTEVLRPDHVIAYTRRSTGEKYLIRPDMDLR